MLVYSFLLCSILIWVSRTILPHRMGWEVFTLLLFSGRHYGEFVQLLSILGKIHHLNYLRMVISFCFETLLVIIQFI